jgi:hypothetical protein
MNNNNDKKVQPDINKFCRQDGFAFTAMAVVVAVIFGMIGLFLKSNATLNTAASADHYSTNESFWRAVSGLDFVLENLDFDAEESNTWHDFVYSQDVHIVIDSTIKGDTITYHVESSGYHGGHMRRLTLVMEPPKLFDNTFFDIDSTDNWGYTSKSYECSTAGLPGGRYWGSSCVDCPGEPPGFLLPEYDVLLEDSLPWKDDLDHSLGHICYWLGRKEQNPKAMCFKTIENLSGISNIEISLWLGAAVDALDVDDQDDFQIGDEFEIFANTILIERWKPTGNTLPMSPLIDGTLQNLHPQFREYTLTLSNILGSIDTLSLCFIGNTNTANKYSGFAGVTLSYDENWIIDISSIHEE